MICVSCTVIYLRSPPLFLFFSSFCFPFLHIYIDIYIYTDASSFSSLLFNSSICILSLFVVYSSNKQTSNINNWDAQKCQHAITSWNCSKLEICKLQIWRSLWLILCIHYIYARAKLLTIRMCICLGFVFVFKLLATHYVRHKAIKHWNEFISMPRPAAPLPTIHHQS
jgi:hypothetical protein